MNTDNLVVAVSYAHDSDEFNKKVVAFVSCLREKHGYDAIMDEYLKQKETAVDFNEMMAKMIPNANKVIVLLTPKYKERADQFIGGVGDEYRIILEEIKTCPKKFIFASFVPINDEVVTRIRGTVYPSSLKNNTGDFVDIKAFIEIAYKHWIINTGECHYKFTIEVNDRFKIFKLPYRLQNGIVIKQGYKSTSPIDKIINYRMFERKIQFSEEMINSKDIMEKKSALDFIIDALQYLISTKGDTRNEQYKALALSVSDNMDGKVYAVVKKELDELMKLSNEYFDVRHNDYLNAAKEKREPLNDSQFIEYLYNRAYSILYLLRLKS